MRAQKEQQARASRPENLIQEDPQETARREKEEKKKRKIQFAILGLCVAITVVRLTFLTMSRESDDELTLPKLPTPINALPECLMVFQEIGRLLAAGQEPLPSMRCADSKVPNIVRRERGLVRVSHPNPGAYGLSELFVSSNNPVPQLLD